jgi:hypothetical protein
MEYPLVVNLRMLGQIVRVPRRTSLAIGDHGDRDSHGGNSGCKANKFLALFLTIFLNGAWRLSDSQRQIHDLYSQYVSNGNCA